MARVKAAEPRTSFLNVDLDLASAEDLSPLVQALGRRVLVLYAGPTPAGHEAHLELAAPGSGVPADAESAVAGFLTLLSALPRGAKRLWNRAVQRDLNIGIQGGLRPRAFELGLRPETLRAVAKLGIRVVVTVYGAGDPEPPRPRRRRRGGG